MKSLTSVVTGTALVAVLLIPAGPAAALHGAGPRPEPVLQCLLDCREAREGCGEACRASFASCMAGPRIELRECRDVCVAEFEAESAELEACLQTCRDEILAPAREECGPQRQECRATCRPGDCLQICRPDGEVPPVINECRVACGAALYECASAVKAELRECMMPCREILDEVEREACAAICIEATRDDAIACHETFRSCAAECVVEPTTTTTSLPPEL
jgi:hypothetical protein